MQKEIRLPAKVSSILRALTDAGYEAYAVGGCVRDSLLGRKPGDWDITTSARPEQTKALFRRTVDTGIAHGTVTVMLGEDGFEVTTYRVDGDYSDGRHPDSVSFTASLSEDLRRRDFTVNAMAYHPDKGIVDLFGGQEDLAHKIIRAVGDPDERFDEDALRILRAVRFSAQLGFSIEGNTFSALSRFAERLRLVSRERIQVELTKLLASDHPEQFRLLYTSGITKVIFPLFDEMMVMPQRSPYHTMNVGEHTMAVLCGVEKDPILRLAALLHDTGKLKAHFIIEENGKPRDRFLGHAAFSAEIAEDFLREYRYDNRTISLVTGLIRFHDDRIPPEEKAVRRAMNRMGEEIFGLYMRFVPADSAAKSPLAQERFAERYAGVECLAEEIRRRGDCLSLSDLAVNGGDLIRAGMKPGKAMGDTLKAMLEDVLAEPSHNDKDWLLGHFLPKQGS